MTNGQRRVLSVPSGALPGRHDVLQCVVAANKIAMQRLHPPLHRGGSGVGGHRGRTNSMETAMRGFLNPFTGRPCDGVSHVPGFDRCRTDDERGKLLFGIPNYSEELEKTKRRQAIIDRLKENTNER